MDWRRGGLAFPELILNGHDLAHQTLPADREEEEQDAGDGLAGRLFLQRGLASLDGPVVREGTENNRSIKEEFTLSDAVMQIKNEGNKLAGFQEKKKRMPFPPAQLLGVNEDGSLELQSARPHVCELCSATFRTNYHLQRHAFIHTGDKPFRCDECGMKFIQKYHMQRHRRTHSGEKPYQCCHCQQHFSRTDRVLKHQRMCNENRKSNDMNARDERPVGGQDLGYSSLRAGCSRPEKSRHKSNERPRLPVNLLQNIERGVAGEELGPVRRESPSLRSQCSTVKGGREYSAERPDSPVGGDFPVEAPASEVDRSRNLVLKKLASGKTRERPAGPQDDSSPWSSFDDGKVDRHTFRLVDTPGFGPGCRDLDAVTVGPHQGEPSKPAASGASYDDAMQFLKKKRYLQPGAPGSGQDCALNVAIGQQASAGAGIRSRGPTTCVSASQTTKTEIKSIQDKHILSDEVLQTLLDHYSNKANGQPEVSFGVAGTVSVSSAHARLDSHVKALGTNSHAPPSGNATMLQEYSKFLQQALERTSQNDSYLNSHGLPFVTKGQSRSNPPEFSAPDMHHASSGRAPSGMHSSLRSSSEKVRFGLLDGDSGRSFSFSGEETDPSSVSSTEDFLERVAPRRRCDSPVIGPPFPMAAFEQNIHSQFSGCGSGLSSLFSVSSGDVDLHGHEGGTDLPGYPLADVADGRTRPTSSLDSTDSQIYT
ncbi:zinc finger protein 148-like isoform X2 [Conger conger]|uniref:zinc finger protein 148-like isoform X2 n=1 Tax=Conger conger TaxID=82655 RepID=UPI002A59E56C|nr:zinc finger protein 148-like isoform X2 [Conger conger]